MPDTNTPDLEQQLTSAAAGEETTPSSSTGTPPPSSSAPETPATQTTGVQPSSPASPTVTPRTQVTPTEQNVPAWRRMATEYGMQLPETVDEATVLKHLFQGTRQAQQLQRQMQEITPYFSEFQKWRQQQAQAEAAKANKETPWYSEWWNPPEFDQSWKQQITKDLVTGELIPAQGAPRDIVDKYIAAEAHRQKTADEFMKNPFEFMEKAIDKRAEMKARAVYEDMHRQREEQQFIQQTLESPEMAFFYERDEKNNPRVGVDGQPLVSKWGQVYRQNVEYAYQRGLPVQDQHRWALAATRSTYAMSPEGQRELAALAAAGGKPAATPREQANERLHLAHEHAPNVGGVIPGPADGLAPTPNAPGMGLRDMLAQTLANEADEAVNEYRFGRRSA